MSEPPMVTWVSHPNPVVIALLVILGLVILGIAVMCVWLWRTRDTGSHSAGRDWRLPRWRVRWLRWRFRRAVRRGKVQVLPAEPRLTWRQRAIRARLARIPPAENPDPPPPTPFERPLTDWLRDSVVMEAIRITEEGQ